MGGISLLRMRDRLIDPAIGWRVLLLVAVILGAVVRLTGLGQGSLSHPEVYVPGLTLVPGISEPPERLTLAETARWHFHDEPHPMGWYLAMFAWVKLAGTTEWALRLPSVLFGTASILMIFMLGRRIYGPWVGAIAALLLALHGFHAHWSQIARMYVPGAALGLLATLLLIEIAASRRRRPLLELSYGLALFATTQVVELFWPIFMLQILWVALFVAPSPGAPVHWHWRWHWRWTGTPRLLQVQAVALMAAIPEIAHAVYRARQDAAEPPSLDFLLNMLSFGFLFAPDKDALPPLGLALPWLVLLFAAAAALGVAAWRARALTPAVPRFAGDDRSLPWPVPVLAAGLSVAVLIWFASIASRRNAEMASLVAVPLAALALPPVAHGLRRMIAGGWPALDRGLRSMTAPTVLLVLSGIVAPLALFAASFVTTVLASRAFAVFTPYAVLLAAAGAVTIARAGLPRIAVVSVLVAVFALSVPFERRSPISPRDYKGIAALMRAAMQPGDIVLIRPRQWADTPLFYYLPDARYLTQDFAAELARMPGRRVWLVTWPDPGTVVPADLRRKAVAALAPVQTLDAMRARAELFVTPPAP